MLLILVSFFFLGGGGNLRLENPSGDQQRKQINQNKFGMLLCL